MKISLIMATKDRDAKIIERLFNSLALQTNKNFELIVVDQNEGTEIKRLCDKYQNRFPIIHLYSEKGLSKARNKGLKYVSGDIVGFPDDDCWYENELLNKVLKFFQTRSTYSILTGRSIDEKHQESAGKFQSYSSDIKRSNIWEVAISFSIFVKYENVKTHLIQFDEKLGVGAGTLYGSGEETDFLLNLLENGCKGFYDNTLTVFHPNPVREYNNTTYQRAYLYGAGLTNVMKKHNYNNILLTKVIIKPLIASVVYFLIGKFNKSKFYFKSFQGRIKGLI